MSEFDETKLLALASAQRQQTIDLADILGPMIVQAHAVAEDLESFYRMLPDAPGARNGNNAVVLLRQGFIREAGQVIEAAEKYRAEDLAEAAGGQTPAGVGEISGDSAQPEETESAASGESIPDADPAGSGEVNKATDDADPAQKA